jgi:hypothetical protein
MLHPVYGIRSKRGYFSQSQQRYICFKFCVVFVVLYSLYYSTVGVGVRFKIHTAKKWR